MRALSLAALTFLDLSPVDAIRTAAACGFTHVGLRPVAATPAERQPTMLDRPDERRAIRAALRAEGVRVLDIEIVRLTDAIDWDLMQRTIAFACDVGADRLLVADNDPDAARSRDSLARLAALCVPAGVTACLEFMPWTCAPTLAAARDRVAGIDGAAILVDAFHLARSGGDPGDLRPQDRVSYVQLCDIGGPIPDMDRILAEARGDRLLPGDGDCDLAGLLRRCPGVPVSAEIPLSIKRYGSLSAQERARLAHDRCRALIARADG